MVSSSGQGRTPRLNTAFPEGLPAGHEVIHRQDFARSPHGGGLKSPVSRSDSSLASRAQSGEEIYLRGWDPNHELVNVFGFDAEHSGSASVGGKISCSDAASNGSGAEAGAFGCFGEGFVLASGGGESCHKRSFSDLR